MARRDFCRPPAGGGKCFQACRPGLSIHVRSGAKTDRV
jgi:hypothetical protein